ncbi:hypothetical protein LLG96_03210 [bacterium]|nr:hypothetical protein [bacterium]
MGFILRNWGPFGIINVVLTLVVIVQAIRCAVELYVRKRENRLQTMGSRINAILFWSGLIVLFGFIGSFFGASSGLESVIKTGSSDPQIVYAMIVGLLQFVIYSLTVFTISVIVWFIIRNRYAKLLEATIGHI